MFDARGTLGIDRDAPVGMSQIEFLAELETDADDEALARLARSTERYGRRHGIAECAGSCG